MSYFGNSHYWQGRLYPSSALPIIETDLSILEKRNLSLSESSFSSEETLWKIYQGAIPMDNLREIVENEFFLWESSFGKRCPWKMLDSALEVSTKIFHTIELYYHKEYYHESFYYSITLLEKLCTLEDFLYKKYGFLTLADRCFDILLNSYLLSSTCSNEWDDYLLEKINQNTMVYYNYTLAQLLVMKKNIELTSFSGAFRCVSTLLATSIKIGYNQTHFTPDYNAVLQEFQEHFSSGEEITGMIEFLESHYEYVDIMEMVLNILILKEKKAQAEGIILLLLKDFQYQRSREYLFRRLMDIKTKTGFHQNWIVFPTLYQIGTTSGNLKGFAQFLRSQGCWDIDFPYFAQKYHWNRDENLYYPLLVEVEEYRLLFDAVKNNDALYEYGKILAKYFPDEVYQRYAILLEKSAKQARVPFDFEMVCRRMANLIDLRGGKVAKHMIHLFRINYKDNEDFMKSLSRLEEKCF